jgi:hypothetical protein
MTFLGLHAEPDPKPYKPTFCSEMKRLLFCMIYIINFVSVSFTGRPTLLSGRYSTTPMPLDMPDGAILSKGTLEEAMPGLDEEGWSREPHFSFGTIIRSRYMVAQIREEIFDIALSHRNGPHIDTLL